MSKTNTTIIIAITGNTTASALIDNAPPVSATASTGFPAPNVEADEVARVAAVVPDIAVAVPPPAMMAKLQVIN